MMLSDRSLREALAAGTIDEDSGLRPDKHIFVDYQADWDRMEGELPQFTKKELIARRIAK